MAINKTTQYTTDPNTIPVTTSTGTGQELAESLDDRSVNLEKSIDVSGASDYTISDDESNFSVIRLTGELTDNLSVIFPTISRKYTVVNDTTGDFNITVKTSTGVGTILSQGNTYMVRSDGSDIVRYTGIGDSTLYSYTRYQLSGGVSQNHGGNRAIYGAQRLETYGNNQYSIHWGRGSGDVNYLTVSKRSLPDGLWQSYVFDGASGRPLVELSELDAHFVCTLGIDTNGRLVIVYNTRNSAILWRYANTAEDITDWSAEQTGMTGQNESSATYPTFVYGPSHELLMFYREGVSGSGDIHLNAWDASGLSWSVRQHPMIQGTDTTPDTSPYVWVPPTTESGSLHIFWCWRETSDGTTNFDLNYMTSDDGGVTWVKSDGSSQTIPANQANAEVVEAIPQNSGLINQGTAAEVRDGLPVVSYIREDGGGIPQVFVATVDSGSWAIEQVSRRTLPFSLSGTGSLGLPMSRPGVISLDGGGVMLVTNDLEYGSGIMRYVKRNGEWCRAHILAENLYQWEPIWDRRRSLEGGKIDFLIGQIPSTFKGRALQHETSYSTVSFSSKEISLSKTASTPIRVVGQMSINDQVSGTNETPFIRMAWSASAFERFPRLVRWVGDVENTTTATNRAGAKIGLFGLDSNGRQTDEDVAFTAETNTSTGDGSRQTLDTGWRVIPNAPVSGGVLELGYLQALTNSADSATDTITIRNFTVYLAAYDSEIGGYAETIDP